MTYSPFHDALTRRIAAEAFPGRPEAATVFVAMMRVESGFDREVIAGRRDSPAGARGIAQLMPVHWDAVDPLDSTSALRYAAGLFDRWLRLFGDLRRAAAAYNCGPGLTQSIVERSGNRWEQDSGLPEETRAYLALAFASDAGAAPLQSLPPDALPAPGPITQGFGPTDEPLDGPAEYGGRAYAHFNRGVDIGCAAGTPVRAVWPGRVSWAGPRNRAGEPLLDGTGWGLTVWVEDADGATHNYGHLSAVAVTAGAAVERGTLLGRSGDTGASTGPHLSYDVFEVMAGGLAPLEPEPWLRAVGHGIAPALPAAVTQRLVIRGTDGDGLRLRAEPGFDARVLTVLPEGAIVTLDQAAWMPVSDPASGRRGWMWGTYLEPCDPAGD